MLRATGFDNPARKTRRWFFMKCATSKSGNLKNRKIPENQNDVMNLIWP